MAMRFALVGVGATLSHLGIVSVLLIYTTCPAVLANTLAFLLAFGVSFTGNYLWTFNRPGKVTQAMRRFFLISGSAFLLNTALLVGLLQLTALPAVYAAPSAALVVPVFTYLASRLWGFRQHQHGDSRS